ncbi:diacylglycerol kinase kappa [Moschus berezovskii]|uniref:diacylglycerol kinase kappa n=1 Tax=Moschus berezovskii TaxID=68408 RepID=UPI002444F8C0|nr:diacylglycerol kinase kappa [Moschus berezovskii]
MDRGATAAQGTAPPQDGEQPAESPEPPPPWPPPQPPLLQSPPARALRLLRAPSPEPAPQFCPELAPEPSPEATPEPASELDTEQILEPDREPAPDPAAEPIPVPAVEPAPEPAPVPAREPATESCPEPAQVSRLEQSPAPHLLQCPAVAPEKGLRTSPTPRTPVPAPLSTIKRPKLWSRSRLLDPLPATGEGVLSLGSTGSAPGKGPESPLPAGRWYSIRVGSRGWAAPTRTAGEGQGSPERTGRACVRRSHHSICLQDFPAGRCKNSVTVMNRVTSGRLASRTGASWNGWRGASVSLTPNDYTEVTITSQTITEQFPGLTVPQMSVDKSSSHFSQHCLLPSKLRTENCTHGLGNNLRVNETVVERRFRDQRESYASLKILKEGPLLKNCNSFKRWKLRYFLVQGQRLCFAHHPAFARFETIDLSQVALAESSCRNLCHSFCVITPQRKVTLAAPNRKDMEEWIKVIKTVQQGEILKIPAAENNPFLVGMHYWYSSHSPRTQHCNVCWGSIPALSQNVIICEVCKVKSHRLCALRANKDCKWNTLSITNDLLMPADEKTMPHQWVEGNISASSQCVVCHENCGSYQRLQDFWCLWCNSTGTPLDHLDLMTSRIYAQRSQGIVTNEESVLIAATTRAQQEAQTEEPNLSAKELRNADNEATLKISLDAMNKEFEKLSKIDWMNSILFPEEKSSDTDSKSFRLKVKFPKLGKKRPEEEYKPKSGQGIQGFIGNLWHHRHHEDEAKYDDPPTPSGSQL